ncbi:MAG: redoxin domain-containing protein, partial [Muribaculaceae bacterium]|nr:redoxin domain-containing protein [Muribaculaceae bacterium]
KSMLTVDSLPEAVRLRVEDQLRTASLNRPGTIATDFKFVDRNGNQSCLYDLTGEKFLLIFYDPECSHCSEILRYIAADDIIESAISHGSLTVIAIYAEGKKDVWDSTKWEMPLTWTVGYDLSGILDNDLYDLPAMPIIYLLDSEKRVILKDPEVRSLLNILHKNYIAK